MGIALLICFVLAGISFVVGVVSAVYAWRRSDLPTKERAALGTAVIGVIPGLAFLGQVIVVGIIAGTNEHSQPHEFATFWPALLWTLVGPFIFLRSATLAKFRVASGVVDAARIILMMGWASLSFIAIVYALLI